MKTTKGSGASGTSRKCVGYARVSPGTESPALFMARQEHRIRRYAEERDYEVVQVFQEVAAGANESREALDRLMEFICDEANRVEIVLVDTMCRLARNAEAASATVNTLARRRINFVETQEVGAWVTVRASQN